MNKEQRRVYRNAYRKANAAKESERCKVWREANPEKARDACNRWRTINQKYLLKKAREYSEINVINLTDMYVKRAIVRDTGRKSSEVTQIEIDLKKEQIILHRGLHELKRAINESN